MKIKEARKKTLCMQKLQNALQEEEKVREGENREKKIYKNKNVQLQPIK